MASLAGYHNYSGGDHNATRTSINKCLGTVYSKFLDKFVNRKKISILAICSSGKEIVEFAKNCIQRANSQTAYQFHFYVHGLFPHNASKPSFLQQAETLLYMTRNTNLKVATTWCDCQLTGKRQGCLCNKRVDIVEFLDAAYYVHPRDFITALRLRGCLPTDSNNDPFCIISLNFNGELDGVAQLDMSQRTSYKELNTTGLFRDNTVLPGKLMMGLCSSNDVAYTSNIDLIDSWTRPNMGIQNNSYSLTQCGNFKNFTVFTLIKGSPYTTIMVSSLGVVKRVYYTTSVEMGVASIENDIIFVPNNDYRIFQRAITLSRGADILQNIAARLPALSDTSIPSKYHFSLLLSITMDSNSLRNFFARSYVFNGARDADITYTSFFKNQVMTYMYYGDDPAQRVPIDLSFFKRLLDGFIQYAPKVVVPMFIAIVSLLAGAVPAGGVIATFAISSLVNIARALLSEAHSIQGTLSIPQVSSMIMSGMVNIGCNFTGAVTRSGFGFLSKAISKVGKYILMDAIAMSVCSENKCPIANNTKVTVCSCGSTLCALCAMFHQCSLNVPCPTPGNIAKDNCHINVGHCRFVSASDGMPCKPLHADLKIGSGNYVISPNSSDAAFLGGIVSKQSQVYKFDTNGECVSYSLLAHVGVGGFTTGFGPFDRIVDDDQINDAKNSCDRKGYPASSVIAGCTDTCCSAAFIYPGKMDANCNHDVSFSGQNYPGVLPSLSCPHKDEHQYHIVKTNSRPVNNFEKCYPLRHGLMKTNGPISTKNVSCYGMNFKTVYSCCEGCLSAKGPWAFSDVKVPSEGTDSWIGSFLSYGWLSYYNGRTSKTPIPCEFNVQLPFQTHVFDNRTTVFKTESARIRENQLRWVDQEEYHHIGTIHSFSEQLEEQLENLQKQEDIKTFLSYRVGKLDENGEPMVKPTVPTLNNVSIIDDFKMPYGVHKLVVEGNCQLMVNTEQAKGYCDSKNIPYRIYSVQDPYQFCADRIPIWTDKEGKSYGGVLVTENDDEAKRLLDRISQLKELVTASEITYQNTLEQQEKDVRSRSEKLQKELEDLEASLKHEMDKKQKDHEKSRIALDTVIKQLKQMCHDKENQLNSMKLQLDKKTKEVKTLTEMTQGIREFYNIGGETDQEALYLLAEHLTGLKNESARYETLNAEALVKTKQIQMSLFQLTQQVEREANNLNEVAHEYNMVLRRLSGIKTVYGFFDDTTLSSLSACYTANPDMIIASYQAHIKDRVKEITQVRKQLQQQMDEEISLKRTTLKNIQEEVDKATANSQKTIVEAQNKAQEEVLRLEQHNLAQLEAIRAKAAGEIDSLTQECTKRYNDYKQKSEERLKKAIDDMEKEHGTKITDLQELAKLTKIRRDYYSDQKVDDRINGDNICYIKKWADLRGDLIKQSTELTLGNVVAAFNTDDLTKQPDGSAQRFARVVRNGDTWMIARWLQHIYYGAAEPRDTEFWTTPTLSYNSTAANYMRVSTDACKLLSSTSHFLTRKECVLCNKNKCKHDYITNPAALNSPTGDDGLPIGFLQLSNTADETDKRLLVVNLAELIALNRTAHILSSLRNLKHEFLMVPFYHFDGNGGSGKTSLFEKPVVVVDSRNESRTVAFEIVSKLAGTGASVATTSQKFHTGHKINPIIVDEAPLLTKEAITAICLRTSSPMVPMFIYDCMQGNSAGKKDDLLAGTNSMDKCATTEHYCFRTEDEWPFYRYAPGPIANFILDRIYNTNPAWISRHPNKKVVAKGTEALILEVNSSCPKNAQAVALSKQGGRESLYSLQGKTILHCLHLEDVLNKPIGGLSFKDRCVTVLFTRGPRISINQQTFDHLFTQLNHFPDFDQPEIDARHKIFQSYDWHRQPHITPEQDINRTALKFASVAKATRAYLPLSIDSFCDLSYHDGGMTKAFQAVGFKQVGRACDKSLKGATNKEKFWINKDSVRFNVGGTQLYLIDIPNYSQDKNQYVTKPQMLMALRHILDKVRHAHIVYKTTIGGAWPGIYLAHQNYDKEIWYEKREHYFIVNAQTLDHNSVAPDLNSMGVRPLLKQPAKCAFLHYFAPDVKYKSDDNYDIYASNKNTWKPKYANNREDGYVLPEQAAVYAVKAGHAPNCPEDILLCFFHPHSVGKASNHDLEAFASRWQSYRCSVVYDMKHNAYHVYSQNKEIASYTSVSKVPVYNGEQNKLNTVMPKTSPNFGQIRNNLSTNLLNKFAPKPNHTFLTDVEFHRPDCQTIMKKGMPNHKFNMVPTIAERQSIKKIVPDILRPFVGQYPNNSPLTTLNASFKLAETVHESATPPNLAFLFYYSAWILDNVSQFQNKGLLPRYDYTPLTIHDMYIWSQLNKPPARKRVYEDAIDRERTNWNFSKYTGFTKGEIMFKNKPRFICVAGEDLQLALGPSCDRLLKRWTEMMKENTVYNDDGTACHYPEAFMTSGMTGEQLATMMIDRPCTYDMDFKMFEKSIHPILKILKIEVILRMQPAPNLMCLNAWRTTLTCVVRVKKGKTTVFTFSLQGKTFSGAPDTLVGNNVLNFILVYAMLKFLGYRFDNYRFVGDDSGIRTLMDLKPFINHVKAMGCDIEASDIFELQSYNSGYALLDSGGKAYKAPCNLGKIVKGLLIPKREDDKREITNNELTVYNAMLQEQLRKGDPISQLLAAKLAKTYTTNKPMKKRLQAPKDQYKVRNAIEHQPDTYTTNLYCQAILSRDYQQILHDIANDDITKWLDCANMPDDCYATVMGIGKNADVDWNAYYDVSPTVGLFT